MRPYVAPMRMRRRAPTCCSSSHQSQKKKWPRYARASTYRALRISWRESRSPVLSRERLIEIGYRMAIFPASAFLAAAAAYHSLYDTFKQEGFQRQSDGPAIQLRRHDQIDGIRTGMGV